MLHDVSVNSDRLLWKRFLLWFQIIFRIAEISATSASPRLSNLKALNLMCFSLP